MQQSHPTKAESGAYRNKKQHFKFWCFEANLITNTILLKLALPRTDRIFGLKFPLIIHYFWPDKLQLRKIKI